MFHKIIWSRTGVCLVLSIKVGNVHIIIEIPPLTAVGGDLEVSRKCIVTSLTGRILPCVSRISEVKGNIPGLPRCRTVDTGPGVRVISRITVLYGSVPTYRVRTGLSRRKNSGKFSGLYVRLHTGRSAGPTCLYST